MCDNPVILNLHFLSGLLIIAVLMSCRPERMTEGYAADSHLAHARTQNTGPAFWEYI